MYVDTVYIVNPVKLVGGAPMWPLFVVLGLFAAVIGYLVGRAHTRGVE